MSNTLVFLITLYQKLVNDKCEEICPVRLGIIIQMQTGRFETFPEYQNFWGLNMNVHVTTAVIVRVRKFGVREVMSA
jgi:hypothetical protein